MNVEQKELDHKSLGKATLVSPSGDIDMHESPKLRTVILAAAAKKPAVIVVDLAKVDFIDSSGIATLVEAMKATKAVGSTLILCGMSPKVMDVFELSRLDKIFKIVPTQKEALGA